MHKVYQITNLVTKRFYIGYTSNSILSRFKDHLSRLSLNNHHNDELQNDFNQRHDFGIKEICIFKTKSKALEFERDYYNWTKSINYNNIKSSEEISELAKGFKHTKEAKEKISKRSKGKNNPTYNPTKYVLKNIKSGEIFVGTQYEFKIMTKRLNDSPLASVISPSQPNRKTALGWKIQFCKLSENLPSYNYNLISS